MSRAPLFGLKGLLQSPGNIPRPVFVEFCQLNIGKESLGRVRTGYFLPDFNRPEENSVPSVRERMKKKNVMAPFTPEKGVKILDQPTEPLMIAFPFEQASKRINILRLLIRIEGFSRISAM